MSRYLTKSRFKLSLECPTKLFYTRKKEYADQNQLDLFLIELAKGGIQIGELAKFYFCDNPVKEQITVETEAFEYEAALKETQLRLQQRGVVVVAEASFLFENCFIRADIVIKRGDTIELYEVKAKSYNENEKFTKSNGSPSAEWRDYLYDVAFQKWVIQNATGLKVKAFLTLVNKDAVTSVPGLARHFKVFKQSSGKTTVEITTGINRADLGNQLLINVPMDDICEWIYTNPVETDLAETYSFEEYVRFVSDHYDRDKKITTPVGSKCKGCEFFTTAGQNEQGLKSGLKECWVSNGAVKEPEFNQPLVLELWGGNAGGGKGPVQKLIDLNKYLLKDADRVDFDSKGEQGANGLGNHDRREVQIAKVKSKEVTPHIEVDELKRRIAEWTFPLHFIDFETSMMPLPWYKGLKPYEGIAFQYSHHIMDEKGKIAHQGQYLSFEPGVFPNFDFVRNLKRELEQDSGTIFRYHNHENSFLRSIHRQLSKTTNGEIADKQELISFIDLITQWSEGTGKEKKSFSGARNMVDLYEVVIRCYYSPHAKGSNSLKQILPAIINDFQPLREKYSKAIYGRDLEIRSLNYEQKIWITLDCGNDPYKTLEQVFDDYSREELDKLLEDMEGLADGATAMMAFNMLQFSEIPLDQRLKIKKALLRYCELDTMAMVMLYEGLKHASTR